MPKSSESSPLRRSSRVPLRIPVTVSGTSPDATPFEEDAYISSVSKFGASLKTQLPLETGMQVKVQPKQGREGAFFQVVWTRRESPSRAGEVGIEYLEVSDFLGITFPE
jgi:hypothetical protein